MYIFYLYEFEISEYLVNSIPMRKINKNAFNYVYIIIPNDVQLPRRILVTLIVAIMVLSNLKLGMGHKVGHIF